jgi:hypothetical protein
MISGSGDESMNIREICLPNFEVSWAGGSPGKPGYWFGSDDGRVQFMSLDGAVDRDSSLISTAVLTQTTV